MKQAGLLLLIVLFGSIVMAGVLGTLDLTGYEDNRHDLKGSTVAVSVTKEGGGGGGGIITACTITVFDCKGQQKLSVPFAEAIGGTKVQIEHFDKSWVIVNVESGTNYYYSLALSSKGVTVLGSALEDDVNVRYAYKKIVVGYKNSTKQCQLYDQELQPLGAAVTILGNPRALNGGAYFYCEGDGKTQIYRVRKTIEKLIEANGAYKEINEAKRLCCIQEDEKHTICKY